MCSDDNVVEVLNSNVAGPSKASRRPRKARRDGSTKRKALCAPPQDVIEISDSDGDHGGPAQSSKAESRVEEWVKAQARAGLSKQSRPKTPPPLPDGDHGKRDNKVYSRLC
jgi:hypothetical protein